MTQKLLYDEVYVFGYHVHLTVEVCKFHHVAFLALHSLMEITQFAHQMTCFAGSVIYSQLLRVGLKAP